MGKLRVLWIRYKVPFLVTLFMIGVLISMGISMMFVESFYRVLMIAQIPQQIFFTVVSAAIFAYIYVWVFSGGFASFKKGRIKAQGVNIKFKDVIGLDDSKREAWEVVQLLKDRARLKQVGGKIIKGVLMVGPPGCGKTLLAKAIASESGIPLISMAGSEFVEIFVGVGASRVRKLFQEARLQAIENGACIIFIDEIEVIGRGRTHSFMGSGEETNSTQNQLLVEMDGLKDSAENIVVIGATNAGLDVMDAALLRPGRFDRKIYIERPNLPDRGKLFQYYLSKVKFDPQVSIPRLARKTVYKTPADIENIIKEAALIAARENRDTLQFNDLSEAMDRIDLGMVRKLTMSDYERRLTAYHESGHLVILYFLHPTDDVFKASIISRGGALGVVHHHPREEYYTEDRNKLLADIKVSLAGYAAEKIKFGVTSSGVASDFQHATHLANRMVWNFGMGGNGNIGDFTQFQDTRRGSDMLSTDLKNELNAQFNQIIKSCLDDAETILRREWDILEVFVEELVKKGELDYDEIEEIFKKYGKARMFPSRGDNAVGP